MRARVSVRAAEDFPVLARKTRQYFRLSIILFLYLVGCCVGAWSATSHDCRHALGPVPDRDGNATVRREMSGQAIIFLHCP
jgi:hypothetical protein